MYTYIRKMKFTKSSSMLWLIIISIMICSVSAQNQNQTYDSNDPSSLSIISAPNCPPPLIIREKTYLSQRDSQNCLNDCCLACPFPNNFYENNKIEHTYKAFAILGIVSFFLMIILAFFFVTLPSQKTNPLSKMILLPLALSVMYFEGSEFFTLNQRQSQCMDPITPADQTNPYCAAQAFFTLGGGYAIACYSALLMSHLHLISVWRVEFIERNIIKFHILIFGSSMTAFIIPYATNNIQSSNICFISLDSAPAYFYFLFFIYIAFAAHLTTFVYMAHISVKSNRRYSTMSSRVSVIEAQRRLVHIKTIFKMQWRALLGALLMLIIYVLNWHFYVFELRLLTSSVLTSSWVEKWIICLVKVGNQNVCASHIDEIPRYNYIVTLLFFNRAAGVLIFMIFAAKKSVLLEAYELITGRQQQSASRSIHSERFSEIRINRRSDVKNGNTNDVSNNDQSATPNVSKASTEKAIRFSQDVQFGKNSLSDAPIINSRTSRYSFSPTPKV